MSPIRILVDCRLDQVPSEHALRIPAAILAWTMLPRLPVDVRRQLRGIWRQLPGVGLVATTSRGTSMIMRRILDQEAVQHGVNTVNSNIAGTVRT